MKVDNNAGNDDQTGTDTKHSDEKDAYSNNVEVGSVGIEGGTDNGASTLRVLKKKHANELSAKRPRKPIL